MNRRQFTATAATALLSHSLTAAEPAALRLRVLSFNLRYINSGDKDQLTWTARRDQAGKVITNDKPDLIGLQEALRPMLDDLAERVSGYEEIGVGREDGQKKGEYSALLVRKDRFKVEESGTFWLSDTPDVPNSRTWNNRVTRLCTWARLQDKTSGRVFHFYNTHLDHESQEARDKGTALILKHLATRKPAGPVVFTGDFNAGEDNSAIAAIKADPLHFIDSWRTLHPDVPASESGTMHGFSGSHGRAKIDYIFVPKETRLIDAEILHTAENGNFPSDHFPIRATVEFPG